MARAGGLEPFFTIHCCGAAGSGGGDRLAVVGVDHVAAGEDAFDVGGRSKVGQAVEQAGGRSMSFQAKAVRVSR